MSPANWLSGDTSYQITNNKYQCTPDIAISEACIFLQGSHTRSVFLDFFLEFCEFSFEAYISQYSDILMNFYDYNK